MFNFNVTIIQGVSHFETVRQFSVKNRLQWWQTHLPLCTTNLRLHMKHKPLSLRPKCIISLRGGGGIEKYEASIWTPSLGTTMPEMAEDSPMAKTGILDLQQGHVNMSHSQSQIPLAIKSNPSKTACIASWAHVRCGSCKCHEQHLPAAQPSPISTHTVLECNH